MKDLSKHLIEEIIQSADNNSLKGNADQKKNELSLDIYQNGQNKTQLKSGSHHVFVRRCGARTHTACECKLVNILKN